MGATYISVQVPDRPTAEVKAALLAFNAKDPVGLKAYLAETVGRWTALYPMFSAESDKFARHLSGVTGGVVLALASLDEDQFLCNLCDKGKDLGFVTISVGRQRKGKQREPVIKKLDALGAYCDRAAKAALIERLCDTRDVTFSVDILNAFCKIFGISNARCSYDYIERGDYMSDLDQATPMELVG
jgi:hypothetical protein